MRVAPAEAPPPIHRRRPAGKFEERLALFTYAFAKEKASELLEGLSERQSFHAKVHIKRVAQMTSIARQSQVAFEFGVRIDACTGLRKAMRSSGPVLQRELYLRLPQYHRNLFPGLEVMTRVSHAPPPPSVLALAERLIKEGTR